MDPTELRLCPTCIDQRDGRRPLVWSTPWAFACLHHECYLLAACPVCREPVPLAGCRRQRRRRSCTRVRDKAVSGFVGTCAAGRTVRCSVAGRGRRGQRCGAVPEAWNGAWKVLGWAARCRARRRASRVRSPGRWCCGQHHGSGRDEGAVTGFCSGVGPVQDVKVRLFRKCPVMCLRKTRRHAG
ncbi:hypothetical protein [Streptomyces sp. 061-3]|uniref:hypothetical protein n=1 Tax=Streptomyces sp. 061-3 TaxID=2789268 RepID=UPI0039814D10